MLKKYLRIFLSLVFTTTSVAYFFLYNSILEAKFSLVSFLFFLFLSLSFLIIANLQKTLKGIILSSTVFFIFLLYFIINLAYFRVFNSFIDLSLEQIAQINFSFIDFIKDFYFLITKTIFLISGLLFALYVFTAFLSKKENNQKPFLLLHSFNETQRENRLARYGLFSLLLVINIAAVNVAAYYSKHPKENWWDSRQYSLDCGLSGNLYGELYQFLNGGIKTIFAKEKEENIHQEVKIVSLPQTIDKKELVKIYLDQMSGEEKNSAEEKNPPKIPKNPHIIFYQLESVGSWALKQNPSPMPYLKELIEKNTSVDHFFANSCQTVNAEFPSLCSFIPDSFDPISFHDDNNNFNCLPSILRNDYGYKTKIFHANVSSFWDRDKFVKKWGFDESFFVPYFRQKASDIKVINTMIQKIRESDGPTFNYVIGFTSHDPHNQELIEYQAKKNNVIIRPYALPLNNSSLKVIAEEEIIRNYFGFLKEVDNTIKNLYANLQRNNLLDKTIVVIYGDHRYYDFPVDSLENFYDYNEIPFVIASPAEQEARIAKNFASQIDIAPTILNLLQKEGYKKMPEFMGSSLFSSDHPNNALSKCLGEITYVDNQKIILGNAKTDLYQKFYSEKEIPEDILNNYIENLKNLVKTSDEVIYTDTLREVKTTIE